MPNANEPRFPTHVAIIVDGNRRWAKQRMLPVSVWLQEALPTALTFGHRYARDVS